MTDKRFKETVHDILTATADLHGLSLESDLKGGDRGYAQELLGRALIRMKSEIVQNTIRPTTIAEGRVLTTNPTE